MNLFSLKNKTAIVTGALGLIGKKHCEALAAAGANVVVADIDEKEAQKFAQKLGANHMGITVDVSKKL
jgi:NAD(P)-dependent dehydrogenase (short-subunit alcohol dehydrogenase family)